MSPGLGGVAATKDYVIVSDREANDSIDAFFCLKADTGEEVWSVRQPTMGNLDYGNSPRATPLVSEDAVYLQGAFGHLFRVELKTGVITWQMDVRAEFQTSDRLVWGICASPLIDHGKLFLNPGGKDAGVAALDPLTSRVLWKSPTNGRSHGSFIVGTFGGKRQLVGHDHLALCGWDVESGRRLWTLAPKFTNDFNVPTPIDTGGRLIVVTENNGARLYGFKSNGVIEPTPIGQNMDLAPDCHTPVLVNNRLFGIWRDLYCLDANNGLKTLWSASDDAFLEYASIIASGERLLVITLRGELLLIDAAANEYRLIGRLRLFEDERGLYSHPALVGRRLYLRASDAVSCLVLPES